MRGNIYQTTLIILGVAATALFGVFLYRELYPEYKIYQNDYLKLEEFRSTYTGQPVPPFKSGIKQIIIEPDDKGPVQIDRCISCHVAINLPHFSPTKVAYDINGNIVYDAKGFPKLENNENYVWGKLEDKITALLDPKVNEQLRAEGKESEIRQRENDAEALAALKIAHVGEHEYDVSMVLRAHPLIGRETRPFEYHPMEEYGCVSCHNGNGRGLTTDKAHGPIFDGEYEAEGLHKPQFLEIDEDNDPLFASAYNEKPGHDLLFQTTPLFVGSLIQAKCAQCHQPSQEKLLGAVASASEVTNRRTRYSGAIQTAYQHEKSAVASLLKIEQMLAKDGYQTTVENFNRIAEDYRLPEKERHAAEEQGNYLRQFHSNNALEGIRGEIARALGSEALAKQLIANPKTSLEQFIEKNRQSESATGPLFQKYAAANLDQELLVHVEDTEHSLGQAANDRQTMGAIISDMDLLMKNYSRGQELYLSQACYACHRIAGFARGGVGPELTREGLYYPWFVKESIVWPQADLKTSTMPNYHLDHDELEDVMTFVMAQTGQRNILSPTERKVRIAEWEAGKKKTWEKPISPAKIQDLDYSMTVFATEGCAACHRLKGFESNVGFAIEKNSKPSFETLYEEREWFRGLIPEEIRGSELVQILQDHGSEIDQRIVNGVRKDSILEKIETEQPKAIEGLYSNFKYALRARNYEYSQLMDAHPDRKEEYQAALDRWQNRVRRVLKMYVQEYGLGRLIGPRPNWAGVYRTDEWLMEHFRNPQSHVARSIMPVLPFDDTKFWALTHMLDVLGKRNRDETREIWAERGFNPAQAYELLCAQCHGENLVGNGPVSEWIYPIPKNLRNAEFLRNLTRERAKDSIVHGIKGGPMPPWGEAYVKKETPKAIPVLSEAEIDRLVDWIFSTLPGGEVIRESKDVPKWQYSPEDVLKELQEEGTPLQSKDKSKLPPELASLPRGEEYLASLAPMLAQTGTLEVSDVFDVVPNPNSSVNENAYYIKQKYYTSENLAAGKAFFEVNCATCHGRDADGAGLRAGTMSDAKPRMLINLDWAYTRDDLRLLRSIKYGVAGTSMTPWGDSTSSLLRMQLVMYIRSLLSDQKLKDRLASALFRVYDQSEQAVDEARVDEAIAINATQDQVDEVRRERRVSQAQVGTSSGDPQKAATLYQQEVNLLKKLADQKEIDQQLVQLKKQIADEKAIFRGLGNALLSKKEFEPSFEIFMELLERKDRQWSFHENQLIFREDQEPQEVQNLEKMLISNLEGYLKTLQKQQAQVEGKIASTERNVELSDLTYTIRATESLKNQLISGFEESRRMEQQQKEQYQKYLKIKEKQT